MNNGNQPNNINFAIEYISDDSNNSLDDFKATAKLISLVPEGISTETIKSKNKKKPLLKKNTRISSNNDEDLEYSENDNDNNSENLNIQLTDNIQKTTNKHFNNSDNNLFLSQNKRQSRENDKVNLYKSLNKYDKLNNSENNKVTDNKDKFNIKEEYDSYNRQSNFSPTKKKKKIILEEKKKNRGFKKSIYAVDNKDEKKEEVENKVYRKDKNGTEICKKNKRKVKIGFMEPFVNITLIESFKKYNIMLGMPKGEIYLKDRGNCQCCSII